MRYSRILYILVVVALLAGCHSSAEQDETQPEEEEDSLAFPWDRQGKEDVFGRSLVGEPRPYEPDDALLENPESAEEELRTNMRRRREVGWETARKVLEPVPLLGLKSQIDELPDCPDAVDTRDVDRCGDQSDADSCTSFASNGVDGICVWDAESETCAPTCDNLTLPDGQEIPKVPRWATWYGFEDINRIFKYAYNQLTPEERVARASFSDSLIGEAFQFDHTAVERSNRWPLRRYTDSVLELYGCQIERRENETDEEYADRCAAARQSKFSGASAAGGGIARMVYSPAMVLHMMRNYAEVLECRDDKLTDTWCGDEEPCTEPPDNFSTCFRSEFPADAGDPFAELEDADGDSLAGLPPAGGTALIKATWSRVGFGFELPAYDTDAEAMTNRMGPGEQALWREDGDRLYQPPEDLNNIDYPGPEDIYTIRTDSGSIYRLTGLHIMTKELRHWMWVTLWWSDEPDNDFGADRPESFDELATAWSNYKMCVVVDYREGDEDVLSRFEDHPSLQDALEATGSQPGAPTWCSNPYIEHAAGNARTNCIGCHQHAGTRYKEALDGGEPPEFDLDEVISNDSRTISAANRYPANGRTQRRTHFATDYSWAFSRLDDLTKLVRTEVEFNGSQDEQWVRIREILATEGSVERGEEVFRGATPEQTCTDCHGENGQGGFGPNLEQRFAQKTDWQLLYTVIDGRNDMPAWGETLTDEELADLFAYLTTTFE